MSESFAPSPTYADLDYTPAGVTAEATERVTMFYPTGSPSDYGWSGSVWPCFVDVINSGFTSGSIPSEIAGPASSAWHFLVRGIAVAKATTVQVANESAGGPNGAGVFRPPGETATNYDQWADKTFPCTHKSTIHLIQYLKDQASTLSIDPDMICLSGRSGGAMGPLWCGLGTDWSAYTGATGQFRSGISTRPAAIIPVQFHSWIDAFASSQTFKVFPSSSAPLTTFAPTLASVTSSPPLLKETSAMFFGFDESKYPGVQALNAAMPCYLYSTDGIGSENFDLDANDLPTLSGTLTANHDGWFVAMLWKRLLALDTGFHARRSRCVFDAGDEPDADLVPYVRTFQDAQAIYADMAEWFLGIAQAQPYDEPLVEKVVANIEATLRQITEGTSYFTTVRHVSRDNVATIDTSKAPLVVVLPTDVDMDGISETLTSSIRHEIRCQVILVLKDRSDAVRDLNRFVRDATTALYVDRTRSGLASNTIVTGVQYAYPDGDQAAVYAAYLDVLIPCRTEATNLSVPL